MSYLHCHKCSWQQDDFYSEEGYNPAKFLLSWNDTLMGNHIDEVLTVHPEEGGSVTRREAIARHYEEFARRIRNMKWVTREQWQNDPNKQLCPKCGHNLCED